LKESLAKNFISGLAARPWAFKKGLTLNFITESFAFLKAKIQLTVVRIPQRNVVSHKSSLLLSFKKEAGSGRA